MVSFEAGCSGRVFLEFGVRMVVSFSVLESLFEDISEVAFKCGNEGS